VLLLLDVEESEEILLTVDCEDAEEEEAVLLTVDCEETEVALLVGVSATTLVANPPNIGSATRVKVLLGTCVTRVVPVGGHLYLASRTRLTFLQVRVDLLPIHVMNLVLHRIF